VATAPRALNHVGVTVPDIVRAIAWYEDVLGFRLIMGPRELRPDAHSTQETRQILGPTFRLALQAHLAIANSVGLELFQFIDPPVVEPLDNMDFATTGYWHLCFTDPNIEELADRIAATGGKQRTDVFGFAPPDRKLVYCEDPFGNVIEIFSHSYEETFSNWA
jgi:catechol 2,3-dioxygenase-like lactoylglutathione lyase family enzyme